MNLLLKSHSLMHTHRHWLQARIVFIDILVACTLCIKINGPNFFFPQRFFFYSCLIAFLMHKILPWNWYGLINEWKHIQSSLEFGSTGVFYVVGHWGHALQADNIHADPSDVQWNFTFNTVVGSKRDRKRLYRVNRKEGRRRMKSLFWKWEREERKNKENKEQIRENTFLEKRATVTIFINKI